MKITSIKKSKVFHITYYEYRNINGVLKQYFKLWNNGDFYGTFKSLQQANAKAHYLKDILYGLNSNSYIVSNSGVSVHYYK